ncbi:MAG: DUF1648 domain-containing protein [Bacteroidota bacterium]
MSNKRPKINVPFQHVDIAIELLSIALLLLMWLFVITEYSDLPDTIASHYNAKGEADGYSNKSFIWILPIIATVIYVGLFILNRYPHLHNYMTDITEENALKHYRFSTRILRVVNLFCVLLFAYITYHIVESAKAISLSLGGAFIGIVIGMSLLLPVVIIIYQKRINKS